MRSAHTVQLHQILGSNFVKKCQGDCLPNLPGHVFDLACTVALD